MKLVALAIIIGCTVLGVYLIVGVRESYRIASAEAAHVPSASGECHVVASNWFIYVCVFEFDGARYLVSSQGGIVRVLK